MLKLLTALCLILAVPPAVARKPGLCDTLLASAGRFKTSFLQSFNTAEPNDLSIEAMVQSEFSKNGFTPWQVKKYGAGERKLYRGFTQLGYESKNLIGFILGDVQQEPRSWNLTARIQQLVERGIAPLAARDEALKALAQDVKRKVRKAGIFDYLVDQQTGTTLEADYADKHGDVICFSHDFSNQPFRFADRARDRLLQTNPKDNTPSIILEIVDKRGRGTSFIGDEYFMFANIDAKDVTGLLIGWPQSLSATPVHFHDMRYFYFAIERTADGAVSSIEISHLDQTSGERKIGSLIGRLAPGPGEKCWQPATDSVEPFLTETLGYLRQNFCR